MTRKIKKNLDKRDCPTSVRVDVWDFNPEENVTEKIKKINEVKDSRGLRKFIKESCTSHILVKRTVSRDFYPPFFG